MSDKVVEKTIKEYIKKYGKNIVAIPGDIIKHIEKRNKNQKVLDFNKHYKNNREDTEFLNVNANLFVSNFFEGENNKSLKDQLIGPFIVNNDGKVKTVVIYLKNNKIQVLNAYLFSLYNETDKTFMWTFPSDIEQSCKTSIYSKMSFCKYNVIKNVLTGEADQLSLWFRVMYYYEKNYLDIDWLYKSGFNTQNFITFKEFVDNKEYKLYLLVDYGIKDPKLDIKMKSKYQTLQNLVLSFKQNAPSNKKNFTSHNSVSIEQLNKLKIK